MNRRTRILCLVALLPACADSCGCGERAAVKPPAVSAGAAGAAAGGAGQAALQRSSGPDPYKHMRNELKPMAASELRSELEAAAKAIDVKGTLGSPLAGATLATVLPDDIGDYEADGAARSGTTPGDLGEVSVAARRYKQGKAVMNLKITDTAQAPQLRADFVPQLTSVGNAPTGEQLGALEDDIPGVRAFHKAANASRAIALIGGRFLVEILVDDTVEPDDAWQAVGELDADDLIDAAKAARAKERAQKPAPKSK